MGCYSPPDSLKPFNRFDRLRLAALLEEGPEPQAEQENRQVNGLPTL